MGLVAHQLTDLSLGRHIQAWPLTASVRLGGNGTSGAMAAQQLLNKGKADPKDVGENALRANPSLVGVQDFLSQINRIASHARYASGIAPYDQEKTSLVYHTRRNRMHTGGERCRRTVELSR